MRFYDPIINIVRNGMDVNKKITTYYKNRLQMETVSGRPDPVSLLLNNLGIGGADSTD